MLVQAALSSIQIVSLIQPSPAAPCKSRKIKLHSGNSARFSDSFVQIRLLRFVCSGLLAMFVLDAQVFYVHLMGFRD